MKRWFRNASVRKKLMVIILSTSSAVLVLTCAAFFAYELINFREATVRSVSTVGKIIAANSTAALAFDNQGDAREVLAALESEPNIVAASLYRQDGTLFSRYPETRALDAFPREPKAIGHHFDGGRLLLFQPVTLRNGERAGTLYVESDMSEMYDRFRGYGAVVLVVFGVASALSYLIAHALQRRISEPILALSETARKVSRTDDYSARAARRDGGELGHLTDSFNAMLARIQGQNRLLALSEKRHRLIFENSPLPMWVYDLETRCFLAVNAAASSSYGYSQEEFLAMKVEDIRLSDELPGRGEETATAPAERALPGPRMWQHRTKDGAIIVAEITSHDVTLDERPGRLVLANDVTARLQAETDLRESEARNRAILNSALSAVIVIGASGEVLEWNARAEAMFGWTRDEARGRDMASMIIPLQYRENHRRGLQRFLATGEGPVLNRLLSMSAVRRDGSEFPIELSISPLKTGETITFCGFVTDITDRKRAEAEIQQLNDELEKRIQQRTAQLEVANQELESFSYSVSHDLRAPLRHVQGYVAMLQRATEGILSEKARRHLKIINDASMEMGQLIDDLLEFSRMGRSEMRQGRVSLEELVQYAIDRSEMATRGRNIIWQIAPLPMVIGDGSMLRQVLVNLVGNAIKYTRKREPAKIEIGTAGEEDERVIVFVRDNGAGFDMNYAHKLFGVFQRLHRAEEFEGTGIGLATVRRVLSRHGGRVWAEGAVGSGATFFFTLKRADIEPASSSRSHS